MVRTWRLAIRRSPIVVGLERFELSPRGGEIRCAASYATDPDRSGDAMALRLLRGCMKRSCVGVDGVEPPRARRPPGYSRVPYRSVTLPGAGSPRALKTPEARRSSSSAGSLSDRSADVSAWPTNRELPGDGESTARAYLPRGFCAPRAPGTSGSPRRPRRTARTDQTRDPADTGDRVDRSRTTPGPYTRWRAGRMSDSRSRST